MTLTGGLSWAMARMAPIMAAAPAMSYFILSMPSAGLMEMPPVSKVMPLPTSPSDGSAGLCISGGFIGHDDESGGLGGSMSNSLECSHAELEEFGSEMQTSQRRPDWAHMAAARWPRTVGVRSLPGSLTRERVKFWAPARMRPSAKPSLYLGAGFAVGFAGE